MSGWIHGHQVRYCPGSMLHAAWIKGKRWSSEPAHTAGSYTCCPPLGVRTSLHTDNGSRDGRQSSSTASCLSPSLFGLERLGRSLSRSISEDVEFLRRVGGHWQPFICKAFTYLGATKEGFSTGATETNFWTLEFPSSHWFFSSGTFFPAVWGWIFKPWPWPSWQSLMPLTKFLSTFSASFHLSYCVRWLALINDNVLS